MNLRNIDFIVADGCGAAAFGYRISLTDKDTCILCK